MENTLGMNIVKRRHELKITQQRLAELSDLSINFISRLERGSSNDVSSTTLMKLAAALGTSMDDLVRSSSRKSSDSEHGPQLTKLINKLENYDYVKAEYLSKLILDLIDNS